MPPGYSLILNVPISTGEIMIINDKINIKKLILAPYANRFWLNVTLYIYVARTSDENAGPPPVNTQTRSKTRNEYMRSMRRTVRVAGFCRGTTTWVYF